METVAKRGYRFVHPAEFVQNAISTSDAPEKDTASSSATFSIMADAPHQREGQSSLLTEAEELPVVPRLPLQILFVLIQIMYLSFYIVSLAKLPRVIERLEQAFGDPTLTTSILIVTAVIGLPVRFYCLSAASFDVKSLSREFRKLFPAVFILDELWALAPFLLAREIGIGLALASTAALIYVPFAQRTLLLMGEMSGEHKPPPCAEISSHPNCFETPKDR